jgi:hypothetical protein
MGDLKCLNSASSKSQVYLFLSAFTPLNRSENIFPELSSQKSIPGQKRYWRDTPPLTPTVTPMNVTV